jgi:hypothetical protein
MRKQPITSRMARERHERSGKAQTHRDRCLAFIRRYPAKTSAEVSRALARYGIDRWEAARRLPELIDLGLARQFSMRRCSVCKSDCVTWVANKSK